MPSPGWVASAIWWQVYPLGFAGAAQEAHLEPGLQHRLPGEPWLDYLVDLGANGLALGPVFSSLTHGYDTVDHLTIDPRLGDLADLDALIAGCRQRGIRVLLDGVFNHVGRAHPRFVAAMEQGIDSEAARWFRLHEVDGEVVADNFEGHDQLVLLDHTEPAVRDHVVEVMSYWLDRGVDGWRLDAAYAVDPAFWAAVLPRVRERHPDAWFVGEVIHGDYAGYVAASTLDSVTQYELWKGVWSSLNDGNFFELEHTLGRHNALLAGCLPLTFVGNHDVTRIASRLEDPRSLPLAVAVLLFVGGTPSVYYGDEQGWTGVKEERFGGDDAIRPAFPGSPDELPEQGWSVYRLHQRLVSVRRRFPWLATATTAVRSIDNRRLALSAANPEGGPDLVLLLNATDGPVTFSLDTGPLSVVEQSDGSDADRGSVGPFGWAIARAEGGSGATT